MVQADAEATLPSFPASDVPECIGKYEIIRDLGKGSSGRVYLSHDPYYGRDVAI
jgi:serine/threonine protein kinase